MWHREVTMGLWGTVPPEVTIEELWKKKLESNKVGLSR
jgi:hypothetical protein